MSPTATAPKPADFSFDLPDELIARYPSAERSASRLMHLRSGGVEHRKFIELAQLLRSDDLLVFNNTKVIPARLRARKSSGGAVEILLERILSNELALAQVRGAARLRSGAWLELDNCSQCRLQHLGRETNGFCRLRLGQSCCASALQLWQQHGEIPLPPYLRRAAEASDQTRYQSLLAREPGAIAAPTASLHFDDQLLQQLDARGISRTELTLHVGYGTFAPIRTNDLSQHKMHSEHYQIDLDCAQRINNSKAQGRRVVAVGTTVVRALESCADSQGQLQATNAATDIFIYPGYKFKIVDCLITNFHLSQSTLLMLVCAFYGRERVLAAYQQAVAAEYRFFSYGDAMLLERDAAC